MSQSKIEWTDTTWNPITGCTKISEGCQNCYAEVFSRRLKAMGNRRYLNGFNLTIHRDLFYEPLKWKTPRRVFVNSMSDIFHEDIPDDLILELFSIMNEAEKHTFQILTKRSERLLKMSTRIKWTKNIWMGVTIESNEYYSRCDDLKNTEAFIKFISAEPLLSELSEIDLSGIDWLIVGGESGPGSRVIEKEWVEDLKNRSEVLSIPFFFKQWGGVRKKKNGNELNGKIYMEFPKSKI